ncbi:hypothetical protein D3C85_512940 [compost metagenome]
MFDLSDLSEEAISLQVNSIYPRQVAEIFSACMANKDDYSIVMQHLEKLAKLTMDAIGIKVTFGYLEAEFIAGKYLCSIRPPQVSSFNPLMPKMLAKVAALDYTNFVPDELLSGKVDMQKCRVSGFYSQINFVIRFTPQMFDGLLDAKELTAVYVHELGHAWTILEFMGQTVITNTILAESVGKLGPDAPAERIFEVGRAAIMMAQGDMPDQVNDMMDIVVCVQQGQERRIQNRMSSKYVGSRLSERVADQFASRFLLGASLVTAFSKIERNRNPLMAASGYDPKWVGITSNLMSIVTFPFKGVTAGAFKLTLDILKGYSFAIAGPLLKASVTDYMNDRFGMADRETPLERTASIRRELVGFLKNGKLNDDVRKQVLADIATIDNELNNVHKYGDVISKAFVGAYNLVMGRTHAVGQATVHESLANNRLYEAAASLKG